MKTIKLYEGYVPMGDPDNPIIWFDINDDVEWYLTTNSIKVDKCTITWEDAELIQTGDIVRVKGDITKFKVTGLKKNKLDSLTDKIQNDKPVKDSDFKFDTRRMC